MQTYASVGHMQTFASIGRMQTYASVGRMQTHAYDAKSGRCIRVVDKATWVVDLDGLAGAI
eukprot:360851-Chlamydomonas_euryale.AAC.3